MASFEPGLLGIASPQSCSCQELLSLSNPKQHGWLRRRCRRNRLHTMFDWPQFYVIVSDKCLYYYKNEISKKPSGAVSLYGYNRVMRSNEIKSSEIPWCFKVEHIQPEMKSFYFSVSSERDMIKWMKAIKDEMLDANNMGKRTIGKIGSSDESESSWGSSDYSSIEEGIYDDLTVPQSRMSVLSEISFDGDNSSDSDTETPSLPVLPPFDRSVFPIRDKIKVMEKSGIANKLLKEPVKEDEHSAKSKTDDYWAAVHFPGSKAEASTVISGIAFNGVYLVRKSEDGMNVLQVYTDDAKVPRNYKICVTDDGKHTLSGKFGPYFDSLEEMLFHYYSSKLPHTDHYLTVPYKLHPEFINNERH